MKVIIVNPPFANFDLEVRKIASVAYPYRSIYLALLLLQKGIEAILLDLSAHCRDDLEKAISVILYYNPDLVVIDTKLVLWDIHKKFIQFLKHRNPKIKIILTGEVPLYYPFSSLYDFSPVYFSLFSSLKKQADFLYEYIKGGIKEDNFFLVEGIAFRRSDGGIEVNPSISDKAFFSCDFSLVENVISRFLNYKDYHYFDSFYPIIEIPISAENLILNEKVIWEDIERIKKYFFSVKEIYFKGDRALEKIVTSPSGLLEESQFYLSSDITLEITENLLSKAKEKGFYLGRLSLSFPSAKDIPYERLQGILELFEDYHCQLNVVLDLFPQYVTKKDLKKLWNMFFGYNNVYLYLFPSMVYPYTDWERLGQFYGNKYTYHNRYLKMDTLASSKEQVIQLEKFNRMYYKRRETFWSKWLYNLKFKG